MSTRKIVPYIFLMLLGLSGCSALSNMDELSVLGDYSREKDNQNRYVRSVDDHYDALLKIIAQGRIGNYKDKSSFVHSFGDPILKEELNDGTEMWLYRYAILSTAKDKVYVYFDRDGKQVKWEKVPCPSFF